MTVRDHRPGFCWQSASSLAYLRDEWSADVSPAIGIAVYVALTELANEHRARPGFGQDSDGFRSSKAEVADRACVSKRSVDKTLDELVRIGLLEIEVGGGRAKPSAFVLHEKGAGAAPIPERVQEVPVKGAGAAPPLDKEEEEVTPPDPPRKRGGRSRSRHSGPVRVIA